MFDIDLFKSYEEQWRALERELDQVPRIPIYHFIKSMIILKRMERLTNAYGNLIEGKMYEKGALLRY